MKKLKGGSKKTSWIKYEAKERKNELIRDKEKVSIISQISEMIRTLG